MTRLYCLETPGLHLGPGLPTSKNVINFQNGYAEVSEDDPLYAEKMSWLNGPGCPRIEVLDDDPDGPRPLDPDDEACPGSVAGDAEATPSGRGDIVRLKPCDFRAPTAREINAHILRVHAPKRGA